MATLMSGTTPQSSLSRTAPQLCLSGSAPQHERVSGTAPQLSGLPMRCAPCSERLRGRVRVRKPVGSPENGFLALT